MKKSFAFISLFLLLGVASIFADVTVKKLPDGNAEVTFFYGNPRATEVLLAGDFTDWQNGALPMEKGEKGFTLVKTFGPKDELRYKFISDGNWTTDLKAPDFVDDGFGGKNSHVVIADMLGGDDSGDSKAKINFVSWTMIGTQANFLTQGANDATKKGFDLNSMTVGLKSYDKFVGNFLPNCPVYVEIALAETEMEDYEHDNIAEGTKQVYLYRKNEFDNELVSWEDGLKNLVNGIAANPVAYLARSKNNEFDTSAGPGSNAFLGHLKFGFNTPYINYLSGFNYAKPDVRNAILWTTVSGSWDAGYQHLGGFNVFSLGDKAVAGLEEKTGLKFDIGFAPNKSADRKGKKYGYWAWAGVKNDMFAVDFQSNGMYEGLLFDDPVEHDFILGAKMPEIEAGDLKLSIALQGLVATHQKDSAELAAINGVDNKKDDDKSDKANVTDYFGYSTDVFYRSGDFDGIKNIAAQAQVGLKGDIFETTLSYRMRGAQASMLYVRENHDDGTFDLSEMLGVLNSQTIDFKGSLNLMDGALGINLGVKAKMPLENLTEDKFVAEYNANVEDWYKTRFWSDMHPLFDEKGGAEFTFKPAVSFNAKDATDIDMSFGVYGDMNVKAFTYKDDNKTNDYSVSDSPFRLKFAGLTFNYKASDKDAIVKGVDVFYGFDNENAKRNFNTLVGQVKFPADQAVTLALGLKTINSNDAAKASDYDSNSDLNNPFAFAVGYSKKFKAMKKPTVYAQFVYNMDPFKHFGDGQDALNMNRGNVNGSFAKEGSGSCDAVDWYDGRAAMRVGIRWDI